MKAAVDASDPEAMLRAWMPLGAQGFEQFQKFLWDAGARATGKKEKPRARWRLRCIRTRFSRCRAAGAGQELRWFGYPARKLPMRCRSLAGPDLPRPRMAALRKIIASSGEPIDEGLVLWFPGPGQFHRRGCGGIPGPWRPRHDRGVARRSRSVSRACGWRNLASSPAAQWRTGNSILPKPKHWRT